MKSETAERIARRPDFLETRPSAWVGAAQRWSAILWRLSGFALLAALCLWCVGCGGENSLESLLVRYENRATVSDRFGRLYRLQGYKLERSLDTWRTWTELGTVPARGYPVWGYRLACGDEGVLYSVHVGAGKGKKAVLVSKSSDGGQTWTHPSAVNGDVWAQRTDPRIASQGRDVYVAWVERAERGPTGEGRPGGVYISSSSNGGLDWGRETWIREGEDCWLSAGDDESIYLVYVGGERQDMVFVSSSKDKARTWDSETTGEIRMMIKEPYILAKGETLYLFFMGSRPAFADMSPGKSLEYRTYFMRSMDGGKRWTRAAELEDEGDI